MSLMNDSINISIMAAKNSDMYKGKIILAPMVRIGTLPMRLLALEFGADLVYSEELIDWKILRSKRIFNKALNTVDFIDETDGTVVFRTCGKESGKNILQIGTCNPERALQAAKLMEDDIAGVDINMGCPKEFSIKGGMGAALLSQPEKAKAILRTLTSNLKIPVTCKVRVQEDEESTIDFCKELESCGISAIAVHGRTKHERPQHQNRNQLLKKISQSLSIPVIANGGSKEIEKYEDINKFKKDTGCSSVMLARAAEWNVSIFDKNGKLQIDKIIVKYLKLAITYDNSPSNTKYCIQNMLRELQETELGKKFLEAQTLQQMSVLWSLEEFYKEMVEQQEQNGLIGRRDVQPVGHKKICLDSDVTAMECVFIRNLYPSDPDLPKTRLLMWTKSNGLKIPQYQTIQVDKLFRSTVTVHGLRYTSTFWEKNKRWAEQGAAIVCLCSIGILDKKFLKENGVLR
ncbi:tRNA-dihydrouridine(20) synthase [NAD(P)+]-like [Cimex lectularius]|uniref:DRBM domain-containing protein n=1 Tax=Cimex lectularius TaxID=79782 RepID=A0A8I6RTB8_CIMLE|nr:tRNA-dihydrouridine(20) synthase [NAD(P)+]-like [Cimex lectularius]